MKFSFIIAALLAASVSWAAGTDVGNPGDAVVFDFIRASREGLESLRKNAYLVPYIKVADFENSIQTAQISNSNDPLVLNGIEVDAINYPAKKAIVFNRPRWIAQTDRYLKIALAVHEHLGLLGFSDPNYALTFQVLGDSTLPITPVTPAKGAVDILVVVDDSGSMHIHQKNLANFASAFFIPLEKGLLNYQIGVVTTTADITAMNPYNPVGPGNNGILRSAFVTPNSKDGLATFSNAVLAGTNGSGEEMAFQAIQMALSEPVVSNQNKNFLRPEANLEIVIVSDAEDNSSIQSAALFDFLQKLKTTYKRSVRVHTLSTEGTNECPNETFTAGRPPKVAELVKMTKGFEYSLCSPRMDMDLQSLALEIVKSAPQ